MKPAVIASALFAISLSIVLVACGAQWSISNVRVNPQILGGTDPVLPVVLVAPQQTSVLFEIEIARDAGFQSPIEIWVQGVITAAAVRRNTLRLRFQVHPAGEAGSS